MQTNTGQYVKVAGTLPHGFWCSKRSQISCKTVTFTIPKMYFLLVFHDTHCFKTVLLVIYSWLCKEAPEAEWVAGVGFPVLVHRR